jgi:hypothetical protein
VNKAIEALLQHHRLQNDQPPAAASELAELFGICSKTVLRMGLPYVQFGTAARRFPIPSLREHLLSADHSFGDSP